MIMELKNLLLLKIKFFIAQNVFLPTFSPPWLINKFNYFAADRKSLFAIWTETALPSTTH